MTLCSFALQVLQKTVCEPILAPLAPGLFLTLRAAMRTIELHCVLSRIAVQSSPARSAHTNNLRNVPVHGISSWDLRPPNLMPRARHGMYPLEICLSRQYVSQVLILDRPFGLLR